MNKIQISLFLAGILAVAGLTYGIMASNKGELSEFIVPVSKQFVYYDEILIDELQQKLMTLSQLQQFDLLNQFVKEGHKFFSPNQILKIFQVMQSDEGRSYAVNIIKPYIPAISVDEFLQILPFVLTDYISSSIFIGQIYNLSEDTAKLIAQKYLQPQYAFKNLLQPQLVKYFNSGFLLTQEGQHIAFLIDSSNSMKTVGFVRDGKDQLTRQNLLQQFYYEARYNLFNNFFTFSFARVQPCQYGAYSNNNFIDHYEQIKYLNSVVNNYPADGETDLYSGMATILANSNDRLSDVYILSDGIVTQNTNKLEDFISYIDFQNSRRKNKIRINTISFLLGGDEPQSVRDEATALLQGLADHTNGTFIQYVPY